MAWNPDDELPKGPLASHERQKVRRVVHWYDRRAVFRASLALWAKWLAALPAAAVALWQILHFLTGK